MGVSAAEAGFLSDRQRNVHSGFPAENESYFALRVFFVVNEHQRDIRYIRTCRAGLYSQAQLLKEGGGIIRYEVTFVIQTVDFSQV